VSLPGCKGFKAWFIDWLRPSDKCFRATIKYEIDNRELALFSIQHASATHEQANFAKGHLVNMLLASAFRKNEDNEEWKKNFKRYCKEVKNACN